MVFDFASTSNAKDYVNLCAEIQAKAKDLGHEITLLVNNVQRMDPGQGKLHKATDEELI